MLLCGHIDDPTQRIFEYNDVGIIIADKTGVFEFQRFSEADCEPHATVCHGSRKRGCADGQVFLAAYADFVGRHGRQTPRVVRLAHDWRQHVLPHLCRSQVMHGVITFRAVRAERTAGYTPPDTSEEL